MALIAWTPEKLAAYGKPPKASASKAAPAPAADAVLQAALKQSGHIYTVAGKTKAVGDVCAAKGTDALLSGVEGLLLVPTAAAGADAATRGALVCCTSSGARRIATAPPHAVDKLPFGPARAVKCAAWCGGKAPAIIVSDGAGVWSVPLSGPAATAATLLAGDATGKEGFVDDCKATAARFEGITGLACSSDGEDIVLVDNRNQLLRMLIVSQQRVVTLSGNGRRNGDGPAAECLLNYPRSVALDPTTADPDSVLYIGCAGAIRRLDTNSMQLTTVPCDKPEALPSNSSVQALAATPSGHLIFTTRSGVCLLNPATGQCGLLAGHYTASSGKQIYPDGAAPGIRADTCSFGLITGLALCAEQKCVYLSDGMTNTVSRLSLDPALFVRPATAAAVAAAPAKPIPVAASTSTSTSTSVIHSDTKDTKTTATTVTAAKKPVVAVADVKPSGSAASDAQVQALQKQIAALRLQLQTQQQKPAAPFVASIAAAAVAAGEEIGRGAYKIVYHARWNGQSVAKLQLIASPKDTHAAAAFESELKTLAALRHPNIVQFWGRISGELSAIVELCERGTLHAAIHPPRNAAAAAGAGAGAAGALSKATTLTAAQQWRYARDVVRAVVYLHSLSPPVLHRDIKPHNFLITKGDTLKLTDFGFAAVQAASAGLSKSQDGVGTLPYQSPEQFAENDVDADAAAVAARHKVSTKSDVYGLGGVLLEIFGGAAPWTGAGPVKILQNVSLKSPPAKPPELNALPPALAAVKADILLPCFEADPSKRPTALQVLHAVERLGTAHFTAATKAAAKTDSAAAKDAGEWARSMLSRVSAVSTAVSGAADAVKSVDEKQDLVLEMMTKFMAAAAAKGWDVSN